MSLLSIAPDIVAGASGNLENLGSMLRSATASAASQTTAVLAPAADEVSAAITALFGSHAQQFQAVSAQAAAFHDQFVNLLNGGAEQYLSTEVANAQQTLANAVSAPAQAAAANVTGVVSDTMGQTFNFGPFQVTETTGPGILSVIGTLNTPFGPVGALGLTGNYLPVVSGTGDLLGVSAQFNGGATLNTLLGPYPLFTQTGTGIVSVNGPAYVASTITSGPISIGASLLGNVSGGVPVPTGFTLTGFGLELYGAGGQFGLVPLFLNPGAYVNLQPTL